MDISNYLTYLNILIAPKVKIKLEIYKTFLNMSHGCKSNAINHVSEILIHGANDLYYIIYIIQC